jgi:hypothetical protein
MFDLDEAEDETDLLSVSSLLLEIQSISRVNRKPLAVGLVIVIDGVRHLIERGPYSETADI